jgi:tetrahydromethanopterin S-methyltransferase subunit E
MSNSDAAFSQTSGQVVAHVIPVVELLQGSAVHMEGRDSGKVMETQSPENWQAQLRGQMDVHCFSACAISGNPVDAAQFLRLATSPARICVDNEVGTHHSSPDFADCGAKAAAAAFLDFFLQSPGIGESSL